MQKNINKFTKAELVEMLNGVFEAYEEEGSNGLEAAIVELRNIIKTAKTKKAAPAVKRTTEEVEADRQKIVNFITANGGKVFSDQVILAGLAKNGGGVYSKLSKLINEGSIIKSDVTVDGKVLKQYSLASKTTKSTKKTNLKEVATPLESQRKSSSKRTTTQKIAA